MTKFANDLIASLKQAVAHAQGRKVRGMRVAVVEMPAVEFEPPRAPACQQGKEAK